ncbi:MAG: Type IV fimbrial assembly, ATPase PilB [uncultured Gemmatimonadetes bacterium]|uniref:Type IV fimbrial assembly, ATPase PilB n=1 Tax=uncultured Gemmatimonadota bacterium TaxID=203437 RepID=A0A6J4N1A0_9BACT|nr:MAG: Type IV fimbrial assembly, ATPase PilB [uncultured Gemmatimonadota bacterium]
MAVSAPAADRIGEQLVRENLINQEQLTRALDDARSNGTRVGFSLVKLGFLAEQDLVRALARQHRVPAVDLERVKLDPRILKLIPTEIATKHQVLPLRRVGRTLTVAMSNPTDLGVIDDLKFITRLDIEPVIAGDFTLKKTIDREYEQSDERITDLLKQIEMDDIEVMEDREEEMSAVALAAAVDEAPVVKLINGILTDAVQKGASDIHFECYEKDIRVRYRIDGVLQEIMRPPTKMKAALISRFKILSDLNIAERRVPQDGRLKLRLGKRVIDFRVSTLPTLFGEKIVLRILDKGNLTLDLEKFGMEPKAEQDFMAAIMNPYGMVLVTGPTGSGKTTTLYSALSKINTHEVNIMTAEDPVEYNLHGINQVQVRTDIGMTFAAALKAFLRQDPNIIMVGEIRDLETGSIGIKAALTGHLVLSTLHTNDAPSTITRMVDMGIEPFNVASAVNLITAQRLVRRICGNCKEPVVYPEVYLRAAGISPEQAASTTFYRGKGCDSCNGSGYKGRQGLYEVMAMSPALRRMILQEASTADLQAQAISEGMLTLRMDGMQKVARGITTMEEVLKETAG